MTSLTSLTVHLNNRIHKISSYAREQMPVCRYAVRTNFEPVSSVILRWLGRSISDGCNKQKCMLTVMLPRHQPVTSENRFFRKKRKLIFRRFPLSRVAMRPYTSSLEISPLQLISFNGWHSLTDSPLAFPPLMPPSPARGPCNPQPPAAVHRAAATAKWFVSGRRRRLREKARRRLQAFAGCERAAEDASPTVGFRGRTYRRPAIIHMPTLIVPSICLRSRSADGDR